MVPNKRSKAKNAKIQVIGCYEISSRKSQRSTALGNKKQLISEDSTLSRAPLSVYFARSVLKRRYFFGVSAKACHCDDWRRSVSLYNRLVVAQ